MNNEIRNSIVDNNFKIDGDFNKKIFKRIEEIKLKVVNERYSIGELKIYALDYRNIEKNKDYSNYDFLLICCEDNVQPKELLSLNNHSMWFKDENSLIKFLEYLYLFANNVAILNTDLCDIWSLFSNKGPVVYKEISCVTDKIKSALYVFFVNEDKFSFEDISNKMNPLLEKANDDCEVIYEIHNNKLKINDYMFYTE